MAKNIVLKNSLGDSVVYNNVGNIILKDENGNDVQFIPKTSGQYRVIGVDYDGTIIDDRYLQTGDIYTLPEVPAHNGLVPQGWSCSQEIVDGKIIIEDNDVTYGPNYSTESGLNEFDIEITPNNSSTFTLNITGTKDWGDGTVNSENTHTYSSYGKYTVTCDGTELTSYLFGSENNTIRNRSVRNVRLNKLDTFSGTLSYLSDGYLFSSCEVLETIIVSPSVNIYKNYQDRLGFAVSSCYALKTLIMPNGIGEKFGGSLNCRACEYIVIPSGVKNITSGLQECRALKVIALPKTIENNPSVYDLFKGCSALKTIYIPDGFTTVNRSTFDSCYSLSNIRFPSTLEMTGNRSFYNCYALTEIDVPEGTTRVQEAFNSCTSVRKITFPSTLTAITSQTFFLCDALTVIDFTKALSVPALNYSSPFSQGSNKLRKIYVPDALYDSWKVATNWSIIANYIYRASEMPAE